MIDELDVWVNLPHLVKAVNQIKVKGAITLVAHLLERLHLSARDAAPDVKVR